MLQTTTVCCIFIFAESCINPKLRCFQRESIEEKFSTRCKSSSSNLHSIPSCVNKVKTTSPLSTGMHLAIVSITLGEAILLRVSKFPKVRIYVSLQFSIKSWEDKHEKKSNRYHQGNTFPNNTHAGSSQQTRVQRTFFKL